MRALLDRLIDPLHLLLALACTWLFVSRPWMRSGTSVLSLTRTMTESTVILMRFLSAALKTISGISKRSVPPGIVSHMGASIAR